MRTVLTMSSGFLVSLVLLSLVLTAHGSGHSAQETDDTLPVLDRRADVRTLVDKGLWPIHVMATTFVGKAVQLHYLSYMEEKLDVTFESFDQFANTFSNDWEAWVEYFIGFVICVGFGILALLTMLIAAMVWPCCRCSGKCGGKTDPVNKKNSDRQRLGCAVSLLIFNAILLLGAVAMFVLNERIDTQLQGTSTVFDSLKTDISDTEQFLYSAVDDVNVSVLQRYITSKDQIFEVLDNITALALEELDEDTGLSAAYKNVSAFAADLPSLNQALTYVHANSTELQEMTADLNITLLALKSNITYELSNNSCAPECDMAQNLTNQLEVNVDYSVVDVGLAVQATDAALAAGFDSLVDYIESNITSIANNINLTTYSAIQSAKQEADEIQVEIAGFVQDLSDAIKDLNISTVTVYLDDAKNYMEDEHIADYTYWSIAALSATLCLIIFTNLMGLLHGFACPPPTTESRCSDCDTNQGARWLLTSAALIFIFYWIYVLVVMTTFAAGGSVYTEFCRNVIYFDEQESSGVLGIFDTMISDYLTDSVGLKLEVFNAYSQCERDLTVYEAFNFAQNGYNITAIIDLSAIQEAIEDIKEIEIDIPEVTFYSPKLSSIMRDLDTGLNLDYESMKSELSKPVTTVDLAQLAMSLLDTNVSTLVPVAYYLNELTANVSAIESIANVTHLDLNKVTSIVGGLNFMALDETFAESENFINTNGTQVISQFVDDTADAVYSDITEVANELIYDVENNVANCRPLYESVTGAVDAACVSALYPLNAFWFSLGWCIFFLIPYLILTSKLSNLYKKSVPYVTDYADENPYPGEDVQLHPMSQDMRGHAAGYGMSEFDNFQAYNNMAFDPLSEYRRQLSREDATPKMIYPALGDSEPYEPTGGPAKAPYVIPRPYMSKHKEDLLLPHYAGAGPVVESHPQQRKPNPPAYGQVDMSGDPGLAYLY